MITNNGTTIHLKRDFHTDVATLYSCFSSIDGWKAWWKDLDIMKLEFEVGGEINFSWTHSTHRKHGKILKIEPNQLISFSWASGAMPNDPNDSCPVPVKDTVVTFKFHAIDDKTSRLELIHDLRTTEQNTKGHYEGWTWAMQDLDEKLNKPVWKDLPKLEVNMERTFNAPVEKMFELWTNPELMAKWFNSKNAPLGDAASDLKVGGNYYLDYYNPGDDSCGEPGQITRCLGDYKEIVPNEKLVFSWMEDSQYYESIVTVEFIAQGDSKTLVKLNHANFHSTKKKEEFTGGWNYCFDSQEELLKS